MACAARAAAKSGRSVSIWREGAPERACATRGSVQHATNPAAPRWDLSRQRRQAYRSRQIRAGRPRFVTSCRSAVAIQRRFPRPCRSPRASSCWRRRRSTPAAAMSSPTSGPGCPGSRWRRNTASIPRKAPRRWRSCSTAARSSWSTTSCSGRATRPDVPRTHRSPTASTACFPTLMGDYPILDRVPKGRDEGDGFQLWLRRHDEYDDARDRV